MFGGVGTSETWNSEIDRIDFLNSIFGTLCEGEVYIAVLFISQVRYIMFFKF